MSERERASSARCCAIRRRAPRKRERSEEHTSELQSQSNLVCRLLLEKKKQACYSPRRLLRLQLAVGEHACELPIRVSVHAQPVRLQADRRAGVSASHVRVSPLRAWAD